MTALRKGFFCHGDLHYPDLLIVRDHILVKEHITKLGIAKIQISLPVIVNEYGGVYVVPVAFIDKWMSQVFKGACGGIRYSHCNGHAAAYFVNGTIKIKLSVPENGLRRPGSVIGPLYVIKGEDLSVIRPVDHVLGGKAAPVIHGVKIVFKNILVMSGVKIQSVTVHHGGGIRSIYVFNDGICAKAISHGTDLLLSRRRRGLYYIVNFDINFQAFSQL